MHDGEILESSEPLPHLKNTVWKKARFKNTITANNENRAKTVLSF